MEQADSFVLPVYMLYMYVRIYVCMCVHVYMCVYACMEAADGARRIVYIYVYMYICIHMYMRIYTYMCVCLCVCVSSLWAQDVHISIYRYPVCTYIYI